MQPLLAVQGHAGLAMGTMTSSLSRALPCPPSVCPGVISYSESAFPGGVTVVLPAEALVEAVGAGGPQPSPHCSGEGTHAGPTELGRAGPEHPSGPLILVHVASRRPAWTCSCVCRYVCTDTCLCLSTHARHSRVTTCVYVPTCAHVYTCLCAHTCIYTHVYARTRVNTCRCMCEHMCIRARVYVHTYVRMPIYVCEHACA